jgi:hypothetical protein
LVVMTADPEIDVVGVEHPLPSVIVEIE